MHRPANRLDHLSRHMMLTLSMICLLWCSVAHAGDFWDTSSEHEDCPYSQWGQWADCEPTYTGRYKHRRTREMLHARNSSAQCSVSADLNQTEVCSVAAALVDKLLSQLHSSASSSPSQGVYPLPEVREDGTGSRHDIGRFQWHHLAPDRGGRTMYGSSAPWYSRGSTGRQNALLLRQSSLSRKRISSMLRSRPSSRHYRYRLAGNSVPARPEDHGGRLKTSTRRCREWRDHHNNLIMGGGDCSTSRRNKRDILTRPIIFPEEDVATMRNRDILYLLDESGSVGQENFEIIKDIAASITTKLCKAAKVTPDGTRIGVASFDRRNHPHIYFKNDYMEEPEKLADQIRQIEYDRSTAGSTHLGSALMYAKTHMFTTGHGARLDRLQNVQLVVLITDGCANGGDDLSAVASRLYESNISILTIRIGSDESCHRRVMELSNDSMCWQFFALTNWEEAGKFAEEIEVKKCKTTWKGFGRSC